MSLREHRHLACISQFTLDVEHVLGKHNPVTSAAVDISAITVAQKDNVVLQPLGPHYSIYCQISDKGPRSYIPTVFGKCNILRTLVFG